MASAGQYVEAVRGHLLTYDRELQLDKYEVLNMAHEKSGGQPRIYFVIGAALIAAIAVTAVTGLAFVANVVAFWPVYSSFKSLRSASPSTSDDAQWLTYWVLVASLSLLESLLADGARGLWWLPVYYLAKIAFLVWCAHPQAKGALVVYHSVLQPLFGGQTEPRGSAEGEGAEGRASVSSSAATTPAGSASQRNSTINSQRNSTSQKSKQ